MTKFRKNMYAFVLIGILLYHIVPYNEIDPEVQPYLNTFRVKMWDKCEPSKTNLTWQMSISINENISWFNKERVGVCHPKIFGFDIELKKDFWNYLDDKGKRQLVYHELLHCYLSVDHEKGTIMDAYTLVFSEEDIDKQLNYFIHKACDN